jgi:hypothetical protein
VGIWGYYRSGNHGLGMGTLKMEGAKLRVGIGAKLRRNFKSPLLKLKYLDSPYFYSFIRHLENREED